MDLLVVALVVAVAAVYVGKKLWNMVKPGPKSHGCSCGNPKSACNGCPLVKP